MGVIRQLAQPLASLGLSRPVNWRGLSTSTKGIIAGFTGTICMSARAEDDTAADKGGIKGELNRRESSPTWWSWALQHLRNALPRVIFIAVRCVFSWALCQPAILQGVLGLSEEVHVMLSAYAVTCVKDISLAFVEGFVASVAWDYGQSALGIGSSKGAGWPGVMWGLPTTS